MPFKRARFARSKDREDMGKEKLSTRLRAVLLVIANVAAAHRINRALAGRFADEAEALCDERRINRMLTGDSVCHRQCGSGAQNQSRACRAILLVNAIAVAAHRINRTLAGQFADEAEVLCDERRINRVLAGRFSTSRVQQRRRRHRPVCPINAARALAASPALQALSRRFSFEHRAFSGGILKGRNLVMAFRARPYSAMTASRKSVASKGCKRSCKHFYGASERRKPLRIQKLL